MSNPLVADAPETNDLSHQTAGAGLFYDAAATAEAFESGSWVAEGVSVAGDALDVLAFVQDPLTGLLSAGIGWLMEHISFVSEMLDVLAGNPDLVTQKQQTWNNIHAAVIKASQDYQASASATTDIFTGNAGDLYRTSVQNFTSAASRAATETANAAEAMGIAAAIVGTTRGVVRDLISKFTAQAIEKGIAALAASWCTFGATIAAYIADQVAEGSITAADEGSKVAKLVSELRELQSTASKSAEKMAEYSSKIKLTKSAATSAARTASQSVKTAASDVEKSIDKAASAFSKAKKGEWKPDEYFDALEQNTKALKDAQFLRKAAQDTSRAGHQLKKGRAVVRDATETNQNLVKRINQLSQQRKELQDALPKVKKNMVDDLQHASRITPSGGKLDDFLDTYKEWMEKGTVHLGTVKGHSVDVTGVTEKATSGVEEAIKQLLAERAIRDHGVAEGTEESGEGVRTGGLVSEGAE